MSMSLSNPTISTSAPVNTVVGQMALFDASGKNANARFILTQNSAGTFYLNGVSLTTSRTSIAPGYYSVRVNAVSQQERWKESGFFVIQVTSP
jgi:hypothetical protein